MKTILARLGLAAMIAAGGIGGLASAVQADDYGVELRFGDTGGGRYYRDGGEVQTRQWHRHRDRDREWNRDRDWRRPRGCFPGQAVDMARYQGLRHARIDYITPRKVVVVGRGPYGRERMTFANVRGCPSLGY